MGENATLNRHGFTLIELSLVLVIIGLIVGGVLRLRCQVHVTRDIELFP